MLIITLPNSQKPIYLASDNNKIFINYKYITFGFQLHETLKVRIYSIKFVLYTIKPGFPQV